MKYTVVWKPSAEAELASLWMTATDRDAVTAAANYLDAALQRDPQTQGESRAGFKRVVIVPPIAVDFDVQKKDRVVRILAVRLLPQHGKRN